MQGGSDSATGEVPAGWLAGHALWLPAGASVTSEAVVNGGTAALFVYGPRDRQGGFPTCVARTSGAPATLTWDAAAPGEYLLVTGSMPQAPDADYEIAASCEGCDGASCPTLSECPDVRCDGELRSDDDGCPTCECATGALCDPRRASGPWGTCVRPACQCPDADDASAVCGADGQTWPSRCHALCAGVAPLRDEACEVACPAVTSCAAPCFGRRLVEPSTGCPTCACADELAANAAGCASCATTSAPVCGTDGVTYLNRCRARCAGARILYRSACVEGCRQAPADCELDCLEGLAFDGEDGCVACACADAPAASCDAAERPICAELPGLDSPATVGATCLALVLDADDAVAGPCGVGCDADTDCDAGQACAPDGALAGRCLLEGEQPCACGVLVEPICGADGGTWDNACLAACAGVEELHPGACCSDSPALACDDDAQPPVDVRGCAAPADSCAAPGEGHRCLEPGATIPGACAPDGELVAESACLAHVDGLEAWPRWCAP